MRVKFSKYQGTGNDFIMIDNRSGDIVLSADKIQAWCDRKFGIGSDGIILIEKSQNTSFYMNFYNPDGSQSFCGNGSRCAVRFAQSLGIIENIGVFTAIDGEHQFQFNVEVVRIKMKDVDGILREDENFVLNTGSPHFVIFRNDIRDMDITTEARRIRYGPKFKENGINVNYVVQHGNWIEMRTYERGVEDETLSCGTGVTAAALAHGFAHPEISVLDVVTQGGKLSVGFHQNGEGRFSDIWLSGPANFVFNGEIEF